jgi:hypothetical protein
MATKKKTNYIVYELEKLENYVKQLQEYLDNIDLYGLEDRLDVRYSQNGNPIVKVIASKEAQVKSYRENLEKLPALYDTLLRLRKLADTGDEERVEKARGDKDLPGIFKHKMLGDGKKNEDSDAADDDIPDSDDDVWDEDD